MLMRPSEKKICVWMRTLHLRGQSGKGYFFSYRGDRECRPFLRGPTTDVAMPSIAGENRHSRPDIVGVLGLYLECCCFLFYLYASGVAISVIKGAVFKRYWNVQPRCMQRTPTRRSWRKCGDEPPQLVRYVRQTVRAKLGLDSKARVCVKCLALAESGLELQTP